MQARTMILFGLVYEARFLPPRQGAPQTRRQTPRDLQRVRRVLRRLAPPRLQALALHQRPCECVDQAQCARRRDELHLIESPTQEIKVTTRRHFGQEGIDDAVAVDANEGRRLELGTAREDGATRCSSARCSSKDMDRVRQDALFIKAEQTIVDGQHRVRLFTRLLLCRRALGHRSSRVEQLLGQHDELVCTRDQEERSVCGGMKRFSDVSASLAYAFKVGGQEE